MRLQNYEILSKKDYSEFLIGPSAAKIQDVNTIILSRKSQVNEHQLLTEFLTRLRCKVSIKDSMRKLLQEIENKQQQLLLIDYSFYKKAGDQFL